MDAIPAEIDICVMKVRRVSEIRIHDQFVEVDPRVAIEEELLLLIQELLRAHPHPNEAARQTLDVTEGM